MRLKNKIKYLFIILLSFGFLSCDSENDDFSNFDSINNYGGEVFYLFDETTGAVANNSKFNDFHADIIGASRTLGKINNGLYFGGNNPSYITFPLDDNGIASDGEFEITFPSNEISIEAWVKLESLDLTKTYSFFGNFAGCCIERFKFDVVDGQFRFRLTPTLNGNADTELLRSTYSFGTDTWYHVAFTYDGQDAKIYINGVLNAENSLIYPLYEYVGGLTLGGGPNSNSFPGYIDEFRFSTNLRTETEINSYYQATK